MIEIRWLYILFIIGQTDFYDSSTKGVSLYTRRILVKKEAENVLPKWLRFVKGNIRQLYIDYYIIGILLLQYSFLFFNTTKLKYNTS